MTTSPPPPDDSTPRPKYHATPSMVLAAQIDRLSDAFEQSWIAGEQPRIEDYLAQIDEAGRPDLLRELQAVVAELRRQGGEHPADSQAPEPGSEPARDSAVPSPPQDMATLPSSPSAPGASPLPTTGSLVPYFGDYEILAELARGGMGVVYKARQLSLQRTVALKMILTGQLANEQDVQRFRGEAEAAGRLLHPGIVPIYEVGEFGGRHYFSMALIEGRSLADRLAEGPVAPRAAAELIQQIAVAVHYAHQQGVIHRDLKPANILLDRAGEPKITDFGLAKRAGTDQQLTQSGQVMGTPSYMPPEQASGQSSQVGPASDVYSLGAILYALLCGHPPFQAASPMETILQVLNREPVAPRELNMSIPRDLETICLKCLIKEPGGRYADAHELEQELKRFLAGEPIHARPVGPVERLVRWSRRNRAVAALSFTTLLGLLAVAVVSLTGYITTRSALRAEKQALQEAQRQQNRADEQSWSAESRLYAAEMALSQSAWEQNNAADVLRRLNRYRTGSGVESLRGFEWYYWNYLCDRAIRRVQLDVKSSGLSGWVDVGDIGLSRDYQQLLWCPSWAREWKLLDTRTGKLIRASPREPVDTPLVFAKLSPDDQHVTAFTAPTRDKKTEIVIWEAATGKKLRTLPWRGGDYPGGSLLTFLGSQHTLACLERDDDGSHGVSVAIWDTDLQTQLTKIRPTSNETSPHSFYDSVADNQSRFAVGFPSGNVTVWDLPSLREVTTLKGNWSSKCRLSPDGVLLVTGEPHGGVRLWDVARSTSLAVFEGNATSSSSCYIDATFSHDGRWLAVISDISSCCLWDLVAQKRIGVFRGFAWPIVRCWFSRDDETLYILSSAGTISHWSVTDTAEELVLEQRTTENESTDRDESTDWRFQAGFTADGASVYSVERHTDRVRISAVDTGRQQEWHSNRPFVDMTMEASPAGSCLLGRPEPNSSQTDPLAVWHCTRELVRSLPGTEQCTKTCFSPLGDLVATVLPNTLAAHPTGGSTHPQVSQRVVLWRTATGERIRELLIAGEVYSLAIDRTGRRLAVRANDYGRQGPGWPPPWYMSLWDLTTGNRLAVIDGAMNYRVEFSPDGRRLFACNDTTLPGRVIDAETGQVVRELPTEMVDLFRFNHDASLLAVVSRFTIRVFPVDSLIPPVEIKGLNYPIKSLAFSPDGRRLAATTNDGSLRLWDLATGLQVLRLTRGNDVWDHVEFSPDGRHLLAAGTSVVVWRTAPEKPIQLLP